MSNESDSDLDERIELLKQKYLQRRNQQVPDTFALPSADDGGGVRSQTRREMRDYKKALREIYRSRRPDSAEDDSPEETNVLCTETDVTLPSNLARSSSSSVLNVRGKDVMEETQSPSSGAAAAVHVYQEMLHIYEKLQAERLSQQVWAAELCERERELQQRENTLLQHQRSVHRLKAVEEEVLRRVQSLQQKYQQETNELEAALKHKTKENKRMKSSFDSMKELNDSMKKQLNEVSEQNRKLECQSRKVQARLENLQRKYESFMTHRGREPAVPKACKPENPPSNKAAGKAGVHGPSVKLLALLLDWVVDGQLVEVRDGSNLTGPEPYATLRPSLHERCAKALPVLVEQLHQTPAMEPSLLLSLLRCVYCCLLLLERSSQHTVLTSTLRRLGEEVSRGSCDPARPRACPLFKSSCLHTRFLCSLIVIKTISQGHPCLGKLDVLAQAVDVVSCAVRTDEGQTLFLEYRALPAVLALLRGGSPGLLAPSIDVLLQMSSESRMLSAFLDQCSTEDFFRCASLFLRNPRLEPALMEKMLMLLQKLSSVRKNKRLFEVSSLHLLLQEMHRTADRSQAFLNINLSSILLNLGLLTRS
ncbi:coiled-coil domain-containing protein 138-like isoform X3 [Ctenopharyngodon idella]|uniref:coiled-coil domain-containing protein 138-like isoform X3 n=1 Tax=Ctenopharyngodon idella TaxID=7959 RepID=UPI002230DFD4|nr:coiled-coil domain-containing protein 138-like isoform X3 [Ctenopharyngodon idella]